MDVLEAPPFQPPADLLPAIFAAAAPGADPPARARLRCVCRPWRDALDAPGAWADLGLHPRAYFRRACAEGRLEAARWLAGTFRLPVAAEADLSRPEVARWLVPAAGGPAAFEAPQAKAALRLACGRGDLEHARWLADTFRGGPADPAPAPAVAFTILCDACEGGHLPTARWLAGAFGALLGGDTHHVVAALRAACRGGALEAAQWLAATACPPLEIGHARQAGFLDAACGGCHWEVARWLMRAFGLTRDDFLEVAGTLQHFCEQGCLAAIQWLDAAVSLSPQEVRAHDGAALRAAYEAGHAPVVEWLVTAWGLDGRDVTTALVAWPHSTWVVRGDDPAAGRAAAAAFLIKRFAGKGVNPRLLVSDVCAGGGSALAERLLSIAIVAPALSAPRCDMDPVWSERSSLLGGVCRSGSLKLARRFVEAHPGADLPPDDPKARNLVLWWCLAWCLARSAAMAAWLVETFRGPGPISGNRRSRYLCAACGGRLPAVQWAVGRFAGMTALPADDAYEVALAAAAVAEPDRAQILGWLASECSSLQIVEGALHSLARDREGGLDDEGAALVRYLVEAAGPPAATIAAGCFGDGDVEAALGRGDLATAQWLISALGLRAPETGPDDA